ncbi:putative oxygen-independent coproporphyrinogen III oxidase [Enterococcus sp. PF1-24]|uniref:radical SAM family heme chaperone HemW n=1 Tax=unclassified Enterococcus TaxID=2608891 RepID=UPI0024750B56|nr:MULTISPECIES: radical SAM family heme chaperone HemW [unclassified Enterococcus]MDH6365789.1 putative oxygen-independent coproporphyrinogen III oxidase [Enterococcus sp. PFB1-1]MDH6402894.1 putative oxygen-independent coproporphyrinogen III oxidase [Enterococcus sp. PF1-24]
MGNIHKGSSNKASAYIHIPFCEHICYYCDFNKVFLEGQPVDEYIEKLLLEIKLAKEQFKNQQMETIYIGGGTPTSLSTKQLDRLLAGIREELIFDDANEFTIEANPGDLTLEKLQVIKNYGVNRLSMGVQTFDNQLLKKIGRKHTAEDVYQTMKFLEKENFANVSIDLINALPGQSLTSFRDTLQRALELDLPHYSLYSLILENKTMFMNWVRQGRLAMPNQDLEGEMFDETIIQMEAAGRKQYEISNFALLGKESQHNLVYWNNDNYYGFGAGASGYLGNMRYKNHGPVQHYLEPLRNNQLPIIEKEFLTLENQMEEEMFLGLRKRAGVSKKRFAEKFAKEMMTVYGEIIKELLAKKLIAETEESVYLTEAGLFIGNEVFEQFLL